MAESDQKILCQLLPKLYFPAKPEKMSLYMIHLLLENFNPVRLGLFPHAFHCLIFWVDR